MSIVREELPHHAGTVQAGDLRQPRAQYSSYAQLAEAYHAAGWTDGLPIVPPTPEKIAAFLQAVRLGPADVVGTVPTREITVTAEQVAINAVMAGCKAEYMPVLLAAARAHLSPKGNCHSTTATLGGAVHIVIVNGPARHELGILCREGCYGPGSRANATIGRALRLMIRNACRAVPGVVDRATFSHPGRYSACFGEDEEGGDRADGSGWLPLHVERGFERGASVVTVYALTDLYSYRDTASATPEALLDGLASTARSRPISDDQFAGDDRAVLFVLCPEHRDLLIAAGWSKRRVREYLHPRLVAEHTHGAGIEDNWGMVPMGGLNESRFCLPRAEGVLILGAGGRGLSASWIFYPHLAAAVSCPC
jgi:hypothetical protein